MGMYAKYTPIRVNFDLAPNLTHSDKKLGSATLNVDIVGVKSLRLFIREFREIREVSDFLNSLNSLNSLRKLGNLGKLGKWYQANH